MAASAPPQQHGRYKYRMAPAIELDIDPYEDEQMRMRRERRRRARQRRNSCGMVGIWFSMFFGLLLYFGGGFLFVAAYTGAYPIVKIPLSPVEAGIYWYAGPVIFFVGLVAFIMSFAWFCRRCHCSCRFDPDR